MTHQLDMMPAALVDVSVLERIDAQLPKVREVRAPRLPDVLHVEHSDAESTGGAVVTLTWRQLSDVRMATICNRYVVDREPSYEPFPACDFRYVAKRADLQANPLGEHETFELAAAACDRDLSTQQLAATTKGE